MAETVPQLLARIGAGDAEAAYLLCQHTRPASLTDLVRQVPGITSEIFDAVADGYAAWTEAGRPAP